jgi:hypothetical protein
MAKVKVMAGEALTPGSARAAPPSTRTVHRDGGRPFFGVGQYVGDVALEAEGEFRLELPCHRLEDRSLRALAAEAALELGMACAAHEPRPGDGAGGRLGETSLLAPARPPRR